MGLMETQQQVLNHICDRVSLQAQLPNSAQRRAIRLAARVSLREAADACGVSHTAVAAWERGAYEPTATHLGAYVELLESLRGRL